MASPLEATAMIPHLPVGARTHGSPSILVTASYRLLGDRAVKSMQRIPKEAIVPWQGLKGDPLCFHYHHPSIKPSPLFSEHFHNTSDLAHDPWATLCWTIMKPYLRRRGALVVILGDVQLNTSALLARHQLCIVGGGEA
ncbi:hypothetical protein Vretifemale_17595 [Volvox reticuliferus]|uniref:Uncharacterized protein n=1 Tax=Volvox reticuliferus TaxID=1737510 RepID=A0A8J4CZG1_9CHLO|nr:hypothetical protein Vretifemale_17595 [Volvox reticuliferus]